MLQDTARVKVGDRPRCQRASLSTRYISIAPSRIMVIPKTVSLIDSGDIVEGEVGSDCGVDEVMKGSPKVWLSVKLDGIVAIVGDFDLWRAWLANHGMDYRFKM